MSNQNAEPKSIQYQTTIQAQLFLINLHHRGLMFHLDDDPRECIGHIVSESECERIKMHIDAILTTNLDWGLFEDAYGFCIALINGELDECLISIRLLLNRELKGVSQ